tara:strand:+ start:1041 stop:1418 length:378 start_codon:yes stop_codon:yes gene_type:complete
MRKIETLMNGAISTKCDWSNTNTSVEYHSSENLSEVRLHGHLIAWYRHDDNTVGISSCGYETNTTKSRLNAILSTFYSGVGIFQKNWNWFIEDSRDNKSFTQSFYDGMIVYNNGLSSIEKHPLVA